MCDREYPRFLARCSRKFTPEYLEAKRLKEKARQHKYYIEVTKPKRKKLAPTHT